MSGEVGLSALTHFGLFSVPSDYTHGPMSVVLYVVPIFQDHPYVGAACNSLLNTSAWKNDEEFFHTYVASCSSYHYLDSQSYEGTHC